MKNVILHALLFTFALASCTRERASAELCSQVLDRIVELELAGQGFRDHALEDRKKRALHRTLAGQLDACVGLPAPPGALACVREARSTEEISHRCLR